MRDIEVIDDFCEAVGGLTEAAKELSTPSMPLTPQHIYNWKRRRRVSAEMRLHFLTVFNRVMEDEEQHLDLSWLAVPAADHSNGSAGNGRKSRRKKAARHEGKKPARQARGKRSDAGPRP